MGRVVRMDYPHGWVEEYEYDSIGQLLNVTDSDPSEATVENDYSYDALHRGVRAEGHYGEANPASFSKGDYLWRDKVQFIPPA